MSYPSFTHLFRYCYYTSQVKPLYVQDYIRKTLLETEGKGIGSDDEEEYYNNKTKKKDNASEDEGLSIVEQQEKVRRDFLKAGTLSIHHYNRTSDILQYILIGIIIS